MPVTTETYAYFSDLVYSHIGPLTEDPRLLRPDGQYEVFDFRHDAQSGYYGAIYRNVLTGEIIVAHRGTERKTHE